MLKIFSTMLNFSKDLTQIYSDQESGSWGSGAGMQLFPSSIVALWL